MAPTFAAYPLEKTTAESSPFHDAIWWTKFWYSGPAPQMSGLAPLPTLGLVAADKNWSRTSGCHARLK
jgi:hypothetical protein